MDETLKNKLTDLETRIAFLNSLLIEIHERIRNVEAPFDDRVMLVISKNAAEIASDLAPHMWEELQGQVEKVFEVNCDAEDIVRDGLRAIL